MPALRLRIKLLARMPIALAGAGNRRLAAPGTVSNRGQMFLRKFVPHGSVRNKSHARVPYLKPRLFHSRLLAGPTQADQRCEQRYFV
jgi:hypothetical protein